MQSAPYDSNVGFKSPSVGIGRRRGRPLTSLRCRRRLLDGTVRDHVTMLRTRIADERSIRLLARRIGRTFRAERVILFGSHACGRATQDSDVDLLVVLRTRRNPVEVATDVACSANPGFPLDVLVKTPAEIKWRLAERDGFLTEICEKGKVLYEAGHARMGENIEWQRNRKHRS